MNAGPGIDDPLGGDRPAIFLVGCTGSGKGATACRVAAACDLEIVSLDSMKVYRGLEAGTNKPDEAMRASVPLHLVDVVEKHEEFSVDRYRSLALEACRGIRARGRRPFFVGGTPLYLKAMLSGLFEHPGSSRDPEMREALRRSAETPAGARALHERLRRVDPEAGDRIHPNDVRRTIRALEVFELTGRPISSLQEEWDHTRTDVVLLGFRRERDDLRERIARRVDAMFAKGLVEETRALLLSAPEEGLSRTAAMAIGTRQVLELLRADECFDESEAVRLTVRETVRLARQQTTWFKRFEGIIWLDVARDEAVDSTASRLLALLGSHERGAHPRVD